MQRVIVGDIEDGGLLCEPALRAAALPMEFFCRELLELPIDPPERVPVAEWLDALAASASVQDYVREFTATYGLVCPHPSMSEPLTPEWATSREAWRRWTPLGIAMRTPGLGIAMRTPGPPDSASMFRVPVLSVLEHLLVARTAVAHWLAWEDDRDDLAPVWSALRRRLDLPVDVAELPFALPTIDPVAVRLGPRLPAGGPDREEQAAWLMFQQVVNAALAPLSHRLGVSFGADVPADAPVATVYTAAIWQLFVHVVESTLSRKRCANPSCERWFYRQRDRAEKGQHKTDGVKYCEARCARAVAQRELRRRRREESHGAH